RDGAEVDDARLGRVERGDPGGMGLDLAQLVAAQPPQPRYAVRPPAPLELVERRQLAAVEGDDELPRLLRGDPARLAVLVEEARALDAEARLQRPGGVVDARV